MLKLQLEEWLAQGEEKPISPMLPICDPHHHLFGRLGEYMQRQDKLYLPEDLMQDIGANNIVQTVFMECRTMYRKDESPEMQPVGEMEFVREIADRSDAGAFGKVRIAAGIIGYADLNLGKAAAHVAARDGYGGAHELYSSSRFHDAFTLLKKYNLVFDSWQYFYQLVDLAYLARAFPDTIIIVDHTGGLLYTGAYANKREEVFREWLNGITALAACPNVFMKLGGMGMPRAGFDWKDRPKPPDSKEVARELAVFFLPCIELFGVNRCMFESNFPVDRMAYSYTVMWNAFKLIVKDFSKSEKAALFNDTAARVYRLTSGEK
jgi:L-fuconolactonase